MMSDILIVAGWIGAAMALIAIASWLAHRSYRRFLQNSRGPASTALPCAGPDTPIDALLAPSERAHPGQNGLKLLLDNIEAFAAREQSARHAGRSLDLMYYIWSVNRHAKLTHLGG